MRCKHYFCHLTRPPGCKQSSFLITPLGTYLRNAGQVGWVGIRLASLYCMSQLLLRVQKRGRMYFQHDGAPPHSSREVRNFLNSRFPGRWIGRSGPHNWPARSPDLSPLDYCAWGWMKELVYSVKVVTRDELLSRILDAADRIRNSQLKLLHATRAVHNRAAASVAAGGGIFENQV